MKTFALEAEHIVKRYGSFLAVDNVAIKVRKNNVHSVIGPNGAGKTTLFNALTGTIPLTSGRILVNGNNIENLPVHKRIAFGISRSFQITALFSTLTVYENLRVAAQGVQSRKAFRFWSKSLLDDAHSELINSILDRLSLREFSERLVNELSHGQQRRLEVGMALAARPTIIFLDEPTSGMGIDDIKLIKAIIRELGNEITVLLIEHNMDIVMDISDTVTVMQLGKILVEGTPSQIRSDKRVREAYLGRSKYKEI